MNMPRFTAEVSLRTTARHYRSAASWFGGVRSPVFPAVIKGTHCVVPNSDCPSGLSKMFCPSYDPESCVETNICCTKPSGGGGGGGGGGNNCGRFNCQPGQACCPNGCCPVGAHCCSDGDGCCPNGWSCASIFGWHFCIPI
jgi:hypothetical protein